MKVVNARSAFLCDYEVLSLMRDMDKRHRRQSQRRTGRNGEKGPAAEAGTSTAGNVVMDMSNDTDSSVKLGSTIAADEAEEQALQSLPSNLRTIQYSVLESLSDVHRPCAHQTRQMIPRFIEVLQAWERGLPVQGLDDDMQVQDVSLADGNSSTRVNGAQQAVRQPIDKEKRLTKGERLMLLNCAPSSQVELYTIVEELIERFTEKEQQELIWIVSTYLPLDNSIIEAQDNRLESAGEAGAPSGSGAVALDGMGEEVYVGPGETGDEAGGGLEDHEDLDMLENEVRDGEGAVDDEVPDDS